ncbi:MAG: hypothetical protein GY849_12480 [Deltaproteobacteria bacterium]|nr:hypothetical protein [Deltaproteobacteria bacterium]
MDKKRVFEPGDMVKSFAGQVGMVVSGEEYAKIRRSLREGKRPGHYFAPGCCHNPDYITQIPVLFEDGKYDVMRPMNMRKAQDIPGEKRIYIQGLIHEQSG